MNIVNLKFLFLLLFCITVYFSKAQNNSESFFIAHKKSYPDFFTIFVNTEKSNESIDVYTGKFPKQNLVYSEKLIRFDTIKKHKQYILSGKRSAIYKKGNTFFAEFTGFEKEGYKTKLYAITKEKAYQDITKNCNYLTTQISMLRFRLDSILGHGNYPTDFTSFDDENITFFILNIPFKNFKDSIDLKIKIFYQEVTAREKPEVERLKKLRENIENISFTTAKEIITKTKNVKNIEREIIYCIAEKHPAMFIEILEKESSPMLKTNEIIKAFQEYGAIKEKYKSLFNSLNNIETKAETKQVLLKNLKKGKRQADFLKILTISGGMIAVISIPVTFIVIMNL